MAEEVVTVNNTSAKVPATTEVMMVAYGSLVIMALFPIFVGSYRIILAQQKQKETQEKTGEKPKSSKPQVAIMFPRVEDMKFSTMIS